MRTLFFSLLLTSFLSANPIVPNPMARFSELNFDNNNNWTLELIFPYGTGGITVDSVMIEVNNIAARVNILHDSTFIVITADSLLVPVLLNRTGGRIYITSYFYSEYIRTIRVDSILWGNYPGATVDAPLAGQSICRFIGEIRDNDWEVDYIANNPTIGLINDFTNETAVWNGILYDMFNNPVTQLKQGGYYFQFESDLILSNDGSFTTQLFNTRYNPKLLFIKMADFQTMEDTAKIDSVSLPNFTAGTVVTQDIHINEQCNIIITDIRNEVPINYEIVLINYPNPFNSSTNFVVRIPHELKWNTMDIKIYNSNGQLIKVFPLNGSNEVYWDGTDVKGSNVSTGAYYYSLNIDQNQVKNGSMILLK